MDDSLDKADSRPRLPLPKGYIGEQLVKHTIPFLKWEKYPGLHELAFGRKNKRELEPFYKEAHFDKNKKTILVISDDGREPICGVPIDRFYGKLSEGHNVVIIYVNEFIENVIKQKNQFLVGPINENISNTLSKHIKQLFLQERLELCLFVGEDVSRYIKLPWRYNIPIGSIISNGTLSAKKHDLARFSASIADFQLQLHAIDYSSNRSIFPYIPKAKIKCIIGENEKEQDIPATILYERVRKNLDLCMRECLERKASLRVDASLISTCGDFDLNFSLPDTPGDQAYLAAEYLRIYSTGFLQRKPMPGFHPGVYAEMHPDCQGDPFLHFIKNKRPSGAWLSEVLTPGTRESEGDALAAGRSALHIHIHYTDELPQLIKRLKRTKLKPHLYISTTSKGNEQKIITMMSRSGIKVKEISIYPNRGRDIGPFLSGFLPQIKDSYEIIGHIHLKKSLHSGSHAVRDWNHFLFENTIGGKHLMLDRIVERMLQDQRIGIIYPDDPNIYDWGDNYSLACDLAKKMGFSIQHEKKKFNFPAGSFFWMRPAAFKPLMDLNLQWDDYPEEPLHVDGILLHGLERLFGVIPEQTGYRTILTNVPGVSRIVSFYDY